MSRLEERDKPIITALIQGTREIESLDYMERRIVAKWAGKTSIIESHSIGAECPINSDLLNWMRTHDDEMPGRFGVAACPTHVDDVGHIQIGMICDLIGGGKAAGNIVMIILPKIALGCIFPMLEKVPCDYRTAWPFIPLWPDPRAWGQVTGTFDPVDLNTPEAFYGLADRLEIFHSLVR